jgi:hypothetical protein
MTMPATFYEGTDWQQSSEPHVFVSVQEENCWPVDVRSESTTKDQLAPGLHPFVAVGEYAAPTRPLNLVGVVTSVNLSVLGTGTDRVVLNVAHGSIYRQYVSNILTYSGGAPNTYETTPQIGQPVYIDDSADLSEGVTLSMSPLNWNDVENPLAGVLWYCQDEIADGQVGGARAASTFDTALANEAVEQIYCVMLVAGFRELA